MLSDDVRFHLTYSIGKEPADASPADLCRALSLAVRQRLTDVRLATERRYSERDAKRVYYLSMEFLIGRSLDNNLLNLGLRDEAEKLLSARGSSLDSVLPQERDAALGNGGLGRLAACFLDSLATLGMPGYGYGIHYEFGLFKQEIVNGEQRERPDHWFAHDSPWIVEHLDEACLVPVYGHVEHQLDRAGNYNPMWLGWKVLIGVPHDLPVVGWEGRTVNVLRLYSARASDEFDMQIFNDGDYFKAVEQKAASETVSKVLYPSDSLAAGRELRLVQEYFLVACAVRDIVRRYTKAHASFDAFPSKVAIQLNDTHPALTVAELMRLLVDEESLDWDRAWEITRAALGYTNHTLLPEALEKWSVPLFEKVLPRHLQIIYEINRRFLEEVSIRFPGDVARLRDMSIVEEGETKQIRMAYLSIVGSHSVNGVAALHSELVKSTLVPRFHEMWPERFHNKTNGVTPRRWLLGANPGLAALVTEAIGPGWVSDLDRLRGLDALAGDAAFQEKFAAVKRENKVRLAALIRSLTRAKVDPDSLFDVQIKRIHEYKRQLLLVLHVIHDYFRLVQDGDVSGPPRTYVFAGKAAPGYAVARRIIRLINSVGEVIRKDPRVKGRIEVVFLPDYRVSLAEAIVPAADLSEQISTAGKEASGTGNMKLSMNGALTIGTLDGANVEIREEVGPENFFLFGLTAPEVERMRRERSWDPWGVYQTDAGVRRVMDSLAGDVFCPWHPGHFLPIFRRILGEGDEYFHLADFGSYEEAHRRVGETFLDRPAWRAMAIRNVARTGKFSSDRTIREYAEEVWGVAPVL